MIDSMWNGISGLNVYQKALNSESNNLANVNTVAYKSDNISFSDMMYQNGIGKGSQIGSIDKSFAQGSLKITSNPYDMAIAGKGFFIVQDEADSTFYTRAGNFRMGTDGTLQTPDGNQVSGLAIETPTAVSTNASVSQFGSAHTNFLATQSISSDTELRTINTKTTNYENTAVASGTSGSGYKTAPSKIADIEALATEYRSQLSLYASNAVAGTASVAQTSTATFTPADINSANDYISIYIDGNKYEQLFDTNAATTLNKLSDQVSNIKGFTSSVDTTTGELTITSLMPGNEIIIGTAKINDSNMITATTTSAVSGSGLAAVTSARDALKTAVEAADAEFLEISNIVNLANQDTLTLTDIQLKLDSLNVSDDSFGDVSVENGAIYIKQGDNRFLVGKVVTSVFNNNLGLEAKGNNMFSKTVNSGEPIYAGSLNEIQNNTLELSNSELSEGLVNLMVYQRSFEANSKTVTTSDDLLKTAIQLKK